jgi:hypothetical protein
VVRSLGVYMGREGVETRKESWTARGFCFFATGDGREGDFPGRAGPVPCVGSAS